MRISNHEKEKANILIFLFTYFYAWKSQMTQNIKTTKITDRVTEYKINLKNLSIVDLSYCVSVRYAT